MSSTSSSAVAVINARNTPFSPIHALPDELLGRIFLCLCGDHFSFYLQRPPAFTIAAVSSHWRSLCLPHSRLWSTFAVFSSRGDRNGPFLDLVLERSKQQPLTLFIQYLHPLPSQFIASIARWKHVSIISPSLRCLSSFLYGLEFPVLESLKLQTDADEGDMDMFLPSPKLRTLTTIGRVNPSQRLLSLITKFSYSSFSSNIPGALELCSSLSNLVSLAIREYFPNSVSSFDHPFLLPSLTSLQVQSETRSCAVLRFLTTPALTTLTLGDDMGLGYYVVDDDDREVHKFLDRSRCLLTTLTITLGWATDQVIALLRRLSTLEELTIGETSPCRYENMRVRHWHRPINRTLLESLRDFRKLPSHPPLIPKLRSLTLKVARQAPYILILAWDEDLVVGAEELEWNLKNGKSVFDRRAFVEMVLSRWDPATTTCIRSISLMLPNSTNVPGKDAEEELEFHPLVPLRKEGLVLDLGII